MGYLVSRDHTHTRRVSLSFRVQTDGPFQPSEPYVHGPLFPVIVSHLISFKQSLRRCQLRPLADGTWGQPSFHRTPLCWEHLQPNVSICGVGKHASHAG